MLGFGIGINIIAAYIMYKGTVFGENNTEVAVVILIIGIIMIGTSATIKRKKEAIRLNKESLGLSIANDALKDYYNAASELADAIVGQVGKDHKLSKLIRNKRDSMALEVARGEDAETSLGNADIPAELGVSTQCRYTAKLGLYTQ